MQEPPARRNKRRLLVTLALRRSQRMLCAEMNKTSDVLAASLETLRMRWVAPFAHALHEVEKQQRRRDHAARARAMITVCACSARFIRKEHELEAVEQMHARHMAKLMRLSRRVNYAARVAMLVLQCLPDVTGRDIRQTEIPPLEVRAAEMAVDLPNMPAEPKRRPDVKFLQRMAVMLGEDAGNVPIDEHKRAVNVCTRVRGALTRMHERYTKRLAAMRRASVALEKFTNDTCHRFTEARIAALPQHRPLIMFES